MGLLGPSSPAKAGDPVITGSTFQNAGLRILDAPLSQGMTAESVAPFALLRHFRKMRFGAGRAMLFADRRERTMTTPLRFGLALIGALLVFAGPVQAQNYPNRTITIVVPFPPGGLTDVPARVFAGLLQQKIGQSVVVEN